METKTHKQIVQWIWIVLALILCIPPTAAEEAKPESGTPALKNLPFFHSIHLSTTGNLYITQTDKTGVTIEAENSILPQISAYVKDKVLYLDQKTTNIPSDAKLNYFVNIKEIKVVHSFSNANIFFQNLFNTESLELALLGGFGEASLNIKAKTLNMKIKGAGKIHAFGEAEEQNLTIQGVGEFLGNKLQTENGVINIDGSGVALIKVIENLTVNIIGDGTVKYCGKPKITKNINGNGVVLPLPEKECGN